MNPSRPIVQVLLYLMLASATGFAQGVFVFSNRGVNGGVRAGVYGPEPANPSLQLWGNTAQGRPPGTQTYSGPLLLGTNYSVQAYYNLSPVADPFQLVQEARPVSSSLTSFFIVSDPGFFLVASAVVPDRNVSQSTDHPYYVYLQVRAWDNAGGQYATWSDAWNAANQGSGRAVGWSSVFYQPLDSPSGQLPWPSLNNFESFNLFIVPEPSVAALLISGGVLLFACCRKKA